MSSIDGSSRENSDKGSLYSSFVRVSARIREKLYPVTYSIQEEIRPIVNIIVKVHLIHIVARFHGSHITLYFSDLIEDMTNLICLSSQLGTFKHIPCLCKYTHNPFKVDTVVSNASSTREEVDCQTQRRARIVLFN